MGLGLLSLGVLRLGVLSLGVLRLAVLSLGELRLTVLRLVALPLHSCCVSDTLSVAASSVGLLELGVLLELELVVLRVLCRGRSLPPHRGCVSGTLAAAASGAALLALGCRLLEALGLLEVLEPGGACPGSRVAAGTWGSAGARAGAARAGATGGGAGPGAAGCAASAGAGGGAAGARVGAGGAGAGGATNGSEAARPTRVGVAADPGVGVAGAGAGGADARPPAGVGADGAAGAGAAGESDSLRAASNTVTRLLATAVTDPSSESAVASALVAELVDFAAHWRLDYAASLVDESESVCPPSVGGECALGTDVLEDRQCVATAVPHLASMLIALEGDPDAPDIPTPRYYAEAILGEYSSPWQSAMDVEMASWKSTGTYADEVPPPWANIVSGMWIFRVKRPQGSPPVFKARYVAQGFSQREGVDFFQTFSPTLKMTTLRVLLHVAAQRDYGLHSLDFSTAFLQGSLHEEI
ncbi:unnamed protein product [Closterium sp. NIES-64]|nr:unnamed protein product [Closterium sp. NIES-64]